MRGTLIIIYRFKTAMRGYWHRLTAPFKVEVTIHDHTRIRHRSFPPILEISYLPKNLQERIDTEKIVMLEPAMYLIHAPVNVADGVSIQGQRIMGDGKVTAVKVIPPLGNTSK
jgi:hypothetical protein